MRAIAYFSIYLIVALFSSAILCQTNGNQTPDVKFTQTIPLPFEQINFFYQVDSDGIEQSLTMMDAEGPRPHVLQWNTPALNGITAPRIQGEVLTSGGSFGVIFRYNQPSNYNGDNDGVGFYVRNIEGGTIVNSCFTVNGEQFCSAFESINGFIPNNWNVFNLDIDTSTGLFNAQFNGGKKITTSFSTSDLPSPGSVAFFFDPISANSPSLRKLAVGDGANKFALDVSSCINDSDWYKLYTSLTENNVTPLRADNELGKCVEIDPISGEPIPCIPVRNDCSDGYCCDGTYCVNNICISEDSCMGQCGVDAITCGCTGSCTNCCADVQPQCNLLLINEFHYNNIGNTNGQVVEIVGSAGLNLNIFRLSIYNGVNGQELDSVPLYGILDDEGQGFGAIGFSIPTPAFPINGGFALIFSAANSVLFDRDFNPIFISYGGSFAATDGPALGLTSMDVLVTENSGTPINFSIQLTGTGQSLSDLSWTGPIIETRHAINDGEVFVLNG